jgi:hypothetical protein
MKLATQDEVTIIGYGPWDEAQPKFGEWVRVKADEDETTRRYTLDKSINGSRPAEGEKVVVQLLSRMKATAYNDSEGRAQSGSKEQLKVVGFGPVGKAA